MLNILLLKASPNKNGNTNTLLNKSLSGLKKCLNEKDEKFNIKSILPRQLDIQPCQGCGFCEKQYRCKIKNDDMQDIIKYLIKTDIIIIATPVYFNGIPAQLKKIIDRCQVLWAKKYKENSKNFIKHKKGLFLATGGAPEYKDQFRGIKAVIRIFFKTINTDLIDKLFIANTDQNPVIKRKDILEKAYQLGERLGK